MNYPKCLFGALFGRAHFFRAAAPLGSGFSSANLSRPFFSKKSFKACANMTWTVQSFCAARSRMV